MRRVQIQLTEVQLAGLEQQAARLHSSVAAVVREAVDAWLATDDRPARVARALAAIGEFRSGLGDLAENHDDYLDEDVPS